MPPRSNRRLRPAGASLTRDRLTRDRPSFAGAHHLSAMTTAALLIGGIGGPGVARGSRAAAAAAAFSPFRAAPTPRRALRQTDTTPLSATNSRELRFFSAESADGTNSKGKAGNGGGSIVPQTLKFNMEEALLPLKFTAEDLLAGMGVSSMRSSASDLPGILGGKDRRAFSSVGTQAKADRSTDRTQAQKPGQPTPTGPQIILTDEEKELFDLLSQVVESSPEITSTLRVAGGWVRDKLLATDEFRRDLPVHPDGGSPDGTVRLTRKFLFKSTAGPSMGRQGTKVIGGGQEEVIGGGLVEDGTAGAGETNGSNSGLLTNSAPVDIDIALDDMLGREFADHLNKLLSERGKETISVGVVLKNPEKSKHLETATMKVGNYWIDFVNLRAEEYTEDSRIPDLMRIGTPLEDSQRRDLTINSLFYNINTGQVEDMTGRGFDDLRRGIIATPLPPLTTLLDDPLRVLRSVRFAARLRFAMDEEIRIAASDIRVREALAQKVAQERIGGEVDLMFRSPDPVGAMRLLVNLGLADTVFRKDLYVPDDKDRAGLFSRGLTLLSTTHDHLVDCKISPPIWCAKKWSRESAAAFGAEDNVLLVNDEDARRLLWYAAFFKPLHDRTKTDPRKAGARSGGKKANRSVISRLLVDELKRPKNDAVAVEKILKAADDFKNLINSGSDLSATAVLFGEVKIRHVAYTDVGSDAEISSQWDEVVIGDANELHAKRKIQCSMVSIEGTKIVDAATEDNPVWLYAMEYRLILANVLNRVGPLWRAALILALSEELCHLSDDDLNYTIEGDFMNQDFSEERRGVIEKYDMFAASFLQLGVLGIWDQKCMINGEEISKDVLKSIPKGPAFRDVMDEQISWMTMHPGAPKDSLVQHLKEKYPEFV